MDLSGHGNDVGASELLQAQFHLYNHVFDFITSFCIKTVVHLGVPDIIHNHGRPINLPDLISALQIDPQKTDYIFRLMRFLVHSGFFASVKVQKIQNPEEEEEAYELTAPSRLLVKDNNNFTGFSPFVLAVLDPVLITPWQILGDWFQSKSQTIPFESANGTSFWEYGNKNPHFNSLFSSAMESDSGILMNLVVRECKPVFEGLGSLVDVGGGTGKMSRIICQSFPRLKCTVLDLPQTVANLKDEDNLTFVGGDMFQSIPSADAVLLKLILHNWNDEDCLRILKKSRAAVSSKGRTQEGKVIIIDEVIDYEKDDHKTTESKLLSDLLMMVVLNGRERSEKEWERLFLEAGFSHYKITSVFGLKSLIEVYP